MIFRYDIDKIVSDTLKTMGCDGLVNNDLNCACTKENLFPCAAYPGKGPQVECQAGNTRNGLTWIALFDEETGAE